MAEHLAPCRIALLALIEEYGNKRQEVGNIGGTRYAHFAGDRRREADELLGQIAEHIDLIADHA
jgi:hypothetical protein